jgi:hypothetical protein
MQTNCLISVNPEIGCKADNEFAAKAMHKALSANMRHAKASALWNSSGSRSSNSTCVGKSGTESCCSYCRKGRSTAVRGEPLRVLQHLLLLKEIGSFCFC